MGKSTVTLFRTVTHLPLTACGLKSMVEEQKPTSPHSIEIRNSRHSAFPLKKRSFLHQRSRNNERKGGGARLSASRWAQPQGHREVRGTGKNGSAPFGAPTSTPINTNTPPAPRPRWVPSRPAAHPPCWQLRRSVAAAGLRAPAPHGSLGRSLGRTDGRTGTQTEPIPPPAAPFSGGNSRWAGGRAPRWTAPPPASAAPSPAAALGTERNGAERNGAERSGGRVPSPLPGVGGGGEGEAEGGHRHPAAKRFTRRTLPCARGGQGEKLWFHWASCKFRAQQSWLEHTISWVGKDL